MSEFNLKLIDQKFKIPKDVTQYIFGDNYCCFDKHILFDMDWTKQLSYKFLNTRIKKHSAKFLTLRLTSDKDSQYRKADLYNFIRGIELEEKPIDVNKIKGKVHRSNEKLVFFRVKGEYYDSQFISVVNLDKEIELFSSKKDNETCLALVKNNKVVCLVKPMNKSYIEKHAI